MINDHDEINKYAKLQADAIDKHLKDVNDMAKGIILTMWRPKNAHDEAMDALILLTKLKQRNQTMTAAQVHEARKKHTLDTLSSLWYELIQTLIIKEEKQTMTAEQTLKVLEAIKAGKKILVSGDGTHWVDFKYDPNNIDMNTQAYIYKVAPEYREYRGDEVNQLFCTKIRSKANPNVVYMIIGADSSLDKVYYSNSWTESKYILKNYEQLDGSPLGVEVK